MPNKKRKPVGKKKVMVVDQCTKAERSKTSSLRPSGCPGESQELHRLHHHPNAIPVDLYLPRRPKLHWNQG
jgi:hypothetical protein